MSWDSVAGLNYTVYKSGTLTGGWAPASGVLVATNGKLSFTAPITSSTNQFFNIGVP